MNITPVVFDIGETQTESFLVGYHIDSPKMGEAQSVLKNDELQITGWAIGKSEVLPIYLAVKQQEITRCFPFNQNRGDVVRNFLKAEEDGHPLLLCGFKYSVAISGNVEIGFECDTRFIWVRGVNFKA